MASPLARRATCAQVSMYPGATKNPLPPPLPYSSGSSWTRQSRSRFCSWCLASRRFIGPCGLLFLPREVRHDARRSADLRQGADHRPALYRELDPEVDAHLVRLVPVQCLPHVAGHGAHQLRESFDDPRPRAITEAHVDWPVTADPSVDHLAVWQLNCRD